MYKILVLIYYKIGTKDKIPFWLIENPRKYNSCQLF